MKRNNNKSKAHNSGLEFATQLRVNLREWEVGCNTLLEGGALLGYNELAHFIYLRAYLLNETGNRRGNSRDGYNNVLNKAGRFLEMSRVDSNSGPRFRSVAKLIAYAKKAFHTSAIDVCRELTLSRSAEMVNPETGLPDIRAIRYRRFASQNKGGCSPLDWLISINHRDIPWERAITIDKLMTIVEEELSCFINTQQSQAVRLSLRDLTTREIAQELMVSESNARKLLQRGRVYLTSAMLERPDARLLFEELLDSENEMALFQYGQSHSADLLEPCLSEAA